MSWKVQEFWDLAAWQFGGSEAYSKGLRVWGLWIQELRGSVLWASTFMGFRAMGSFQVQREDARVLYSQQRYGRVRV